MLTLLTSVRFFFLVIALDFFFKILLSVIRPTKYKVDRELTDIYMYFCNFYLQLLTFIFAS